MIESIAWSWQRWTLKGLTITSYQEFLSDIQKYIYSKYEPLSSNFALL